MLTFAIPILCLLPLTVLTLLWGTDSLGADPVATLLYETGIWSLRFLLLTLCVTPLRALLKWPVQDSQSNYLRRLFGLSAFGYSSLHLLCYLWFDQALEWPEILKDVLTRPSIFIGWLSFLLLVPLALTSHHALINLLGKHRWKQLHQLIYITAIGSVAHFWLLAMSKVDVREPLIYGLILTLLLLLRYPLLLNWLGQKHSP